LVNFNNNLPSGATPLDDISGLKLKHITTLKELYEAEFQSITQNTSALLLKPPVIDKLLTRDYLFKLHKKMLGEVWSWAGEKRRSNKSVGVNWVYIDIEIKKLLDNYESWNALNVDNLDKSARLHHKFVWIHPFENGNGRWARLVTNLYLLKTENTYIKWPEQQFYINGDFRNSYITALKSADHGDYSNMIKIHKELITQQS